MAQHNLFQKKPRLYLDGGMGTMLQKSGMPAGEIPEKYNIEHPEQITAIHKAFLAAGSDIVYANTFGANRLKCDNVEKLVKAGVKLAKKTGKSVALDLGPTGKLLKPMGDLDFEECVSIYAQVVNAGKEDADLILIETMGDTYEIKAAMLAAKENCDLPIFVSMIFDEKGRLLTGADVKTALSVVEGLGADVIGFNCGLGPEQMIPLVKELAKYTSTPIMVNPNAGLPESINGQTVYNVDPDEFARLMTEIAQIGVCYLGGCCGTTPEHIKALIESTKNIAAVVPEKKNYTFVTSYSQTVELGVKSAVIGERINPTGKKLLKQALRDNDMDYILREGISQKDCGAHILDVNVGLPEIDEVEMLSRAVYELQAVLPTPLQLDSASPEAMEKALRIYNGKPLINSTNGKEKSMKEIFPLAKKYGGVVVCLCLDEGGIPQTAQGRIEIAEKMCYNRNNHKPACFTLDAADIPDLVPILAVLATFGTHPSEIHGAARLKIKESDRLQATADLLNRLGGQVTILEDGLRIQPVERLHGGKVDSYGDHRIAMCAAIAATRCTAPVVIQGGECIEKSYPQFYEDYNRLGGNAHVIVLE